MRTIDIASANLKGYVNLIKSCSILDDGIKIEPRFGKIELDLSDMDCQKCELNFRRISGNGKIIIIGIDTTNVIISSKKTQSIEIELTDKIGITRPSDSTGEIVLTSLKLYIKDYKMVNWRDLMKRFSTHRNIRIVRDGGANRLFASIGGFIEDHGSISLIKTKPPKIWKRDGDRIVFQGSCEIIDIQASQTREPSVSFIPPVERQKAIPHNTPITDKPVNAIKIPNWNISKPISNQEKIESEINNGIIFNSTTLKAFNSLKNIKNKFIKIIKSNNRTYLLIRKNGKTAISVSNLVDESEYIIIIKAKRLNGNGKIQVCLSPSENDLTNYVELEFGTNFINRYATLKTSKIPYGKFQKIILCMGDSASGEILIEEILVVKNIGLNRTRSIIENKQIYINKSIPSLSFGFSLSGDIDSVYISTKANARYAKFDVSDKFKLTGRIAATTISGINWLNKLQCSCPNIDIVQEYKDINEQTLVICRIGEIHQAKKIWLEPFIESEVTDVELNKLQSINKIFSPSLSNVQFLQSKLPNVHIEQSIRPLPYVREKVSQFFENKNFVLAFNRSNEATTRIIETWSDDMPRLVLVGARGMLPNTVIPVHEYFPYNELLFIINHARFIVDINPYYDYSSSLIELAHYMGKPIVTSNWCGMTKDNCIFIPSTENVELFKFPTVSILKDAINQACEMKNTPERLDAYNKMFEETMTKLLA